MWQKNPAHAVRGKEARLLLRLVRRVPPSFKGRSPDDAPTLQPGACSGATRSLSVQLQLHIAPYFSRDFGRVMLSLWSLMTGLVALRRHSDARGLRACAPSAKGEIAPLRVRRCEALTSHLFRPIILYGIGRS